MAATKTSVADFLGSNDVGIGRDGYHNGHWDECEDGQCAEIHRSGYKASGVSLMFGQCG